MESENIKEECELLYDVIADSKARLKELRDSCLHEESFEGTYSYRIGDMHPAIICSTCHKELENLIFKNLTKD
jgi:hypothetical protein